MWQVTLVPSASRCLPSECSRLSPDSAPSSPRPTSLLCFCRTGFPAVPQPLSAYSRVRTCTLSHSGRHQILEDEEENGFFQRRAHSALPGSGAGMDATGSSVFRRKAQPWRSRIQKPCLPLTAAPSANQRPQPFPALLCFFHLTLLGFVVLHLTF